MHMKPSTSLGSKIHFDEFREFSELFGASNQETFSHDMAKS